MVSQKRYCSLNKNTGISECICVQDVSMGPGVIFWFHGTNWVLGERHFLVCQSRVLQGSVVWIGYYYIGLNGHFMSGLGKVSVNCWRFLLRKGVSFGYVLTDSIAEGTGGLTNILFFTFSTSDCVDNIFCITVGSVMNTVCLESRILREVLRILWRKQDLMAYFHAMW